MNTIGSRSLDEKVYTPSELAELLHMSRSWVYHTFRDYPGVILLGKPKSGRRPYVTLLLPVAFLRSENPTLGEWNAFYDELVSPSDVILFPFRELAEENGEGVHFSGPAHTHRSTLLGRRVVHAGTFTSKTLTSNIVTFQEWHPNTDTATGRFQVERHGC